MDSTKKQDTLLDLPTTIGTRNSTEENAVYYQVKNSKPKSAYKDINRQKQGAIYKQPLAIKPTSTSSVAFCNLHSYSTSYLPNVE